MRSRLVAFVVVVLIAGASLAALGCAAPVPRAAMPAPVAPAVCMPPEGRPAMLAWKVMAWEDAVVASETGRAAVLHLEIRQSPGQTVMLGFFADTLVYLDPDVFDEKRPVWLNRQWVTASGRLRDEAAGSECQWTRSKRQREGGSL